MQPNCKRECKFGTLPERLGIGLQNRGRRFESARYLQEEAANKAAFLFNNYPDFPERPGYPDVHTMKEIEEITSQEYKYGFTTDVETDIIPVGLNEDVIRLISAKKNEPEWLLEFRIKAYRKWLTMPHPNWAHLQIPEIDFQAISYYAAPKTHTGEEKKERRYY